MPTRKPVDRVNPALDTREAAWSAIRKLRTFTPQLVRDETRLDMSSVKDYLEGLLNAGYIEVSTIGTRQRPSVYKLIKDVGLEAPRVRRDGTPVVQGMGREQMWATMRLLGNFSVKDLAVKATTEEHQVSEIDAKSYTYYLCKAGYLVKVGAGKSDRFRFVSSRFTGPKPPQIQRVKQVWDPNTGKVVWSAREGKQ